MRYIITITLFLANMLIANNNIADTTQYQKLADRGNEALDNKHIQEFMKNDNTKDLKSFFNQLGNTTNLLSNGTNLQELIQSEIKTGNSKEDNEAQTKGFRIFYFITEDLSKDLIKSFSYELKKIREIDSTIEAHLVTNGLIGGSFDKMAEYVKSLQTIGIEGITVGFSPWAYEHFKLQKVPAFALSYCDKEYKFKTCNHRFLARGEMSLLNFFELVSDQKNEYKKYYQKLIEAK